MAKSNLTLMTPSISELPAKKKRATICNLETVPKPGWVVKAKDERGRAVWYARIEITGLLTRRYGPFKRRSHALLFLDAAVTSFFEPLDCGVVDDAEDYVVQRRFRHRTFLPIIEDELGAQYLRKERGRRSPVHKASVRG